MKQEQQKWTPKHLFIVGLILLFLVTLVSHVRAFSYDITDYTLITNKTFEGEVIGNYTVSGTNTWSITSSGCKSGSSCLAYTGLNVDPRGQAHANDNSMEVLVATDGYLIRGWFDNSGSQSQMPNIAVWQDDNNYHAFGGSEGDGVTGVFHLNRTEVGGVEAQNFYKPGNPSYANWWWNVYRINLNGSVDYAAYTSPDESTLITSENGIANLVFTTGNFSFFALRTSKFDDVEFYEYSGTLPPAPKPIANNILTPTNNSIIGNGNVNVTWEPFNYTGGDLLQYTVFIGNTTYSNDLKLSYSFDQETFTIDGDMIDSVTGINASFFAGNYSLNAGIARNAATWTNNGYHETVLDSFYDVGTNNFTINVWANISSNGNLKNIWTTYTGVSGANNINLFVNGAGQARFSGDCGDLSLSSGVDDSQWHMYTLIRWGSQLNGYIDGINIANKTGCTTGDLQTNGFIFGDPSGGTFSDPNGYIDEFSVFHRPFTSSEVIDLYQGGSPQNIFYGQQIGQTNNQTLFMWDTSLYPDDLYRVSVAGCDTYFQCDFTLPFTYTTDNTQPEITVTYPTNITGFYTQSDINGTCFDSHLYTATINDTRFVSNYSDATSWSFYYNDSISQILFPVSLTCIDSVGNENTTSLLIGLDVGSPGCVGDFSDKIYFIGQNHDWSFLCFDDLNFFLFNLTCINQDGSIQYSFYQDNINDTTFSFSDNSGSLTQDMTCTRFIADAHTKNDIHGSLNSYTVRKNYNHSIVVRGNIVIEPFEKGIPTSETLLFDKSDRIRWKYTYPIHGNPKSKETYTYYVHGKTRLTPVVNDHFHAHFVVDNIYWVDFNIENATNDTEWKTYYIDDLTAVVEITTSMTTLTFQSLGLLNTNTSIQDFIITSGTELEVNVCPSQLAGIFSLWFSIFLGIGLIIFGIVFRFGLIGVFGSFIGIMSGYTLLGCQVVIGVCLILFSVIMLIVFALRGFVLQN